VNGWHLYAVPVIILLLCVREMTWTRFLAALAWPLVALVLTLILIMTAVVAPREGRDAPLP
jgi:hypothetical protein